MTTGTSNRSLPTLTRSQSLHAPTEVIPALPRTSGHRASGHRPALAEHAPHATKQTPGRHRAPMTVRLVRRVKALTDRSAS